MKRAAQRGWMATLLVVVSVACQNETFSPQDAARHDVVKSTFATKVVVFVIDGPRYQDTFGDPAHAHVGGIWNQLRPLGTLCSNFRNTSSTSTVSGHANALTGVWQVLSDDGLERPQQPTLFEYYRKATGAPAVDAVLVGGKPKLEACAYSLDAAYGASYGAWVDLNNPTDFDTYDRLIDHIDANHPRFVVASFSQVDQKGHSGVWSDYVRQIEIVDSLAVLTWNHLQADPQYAGQTYMFITADHGRHDDAHGGFQNHGDGCEGCQRVIFLALGPDVRVDYEVTSPYTQRDLCTTIGRILQIPTPRTSGFHMSEIFEPTTTGVRD